MISLLLSLSLVSVLALSFSALRFSVDSKEGMSLFCFVSAEYSPFFGIEKGAVLQEARVFNEPQLDARRCAQVIIVHQYEALQPGALEVSRVLHSCGTRMYLDLILEKLITKQN